jgi:cation diffusion facilitator family transporter
MRWVRDYRPKPNDHRLFKIALIITIAGNILLAVLKGLVAYFSGSVAVYADAPNSISDVLYSILMVVGLWVALRPPDLSHPQGHSRYEPLVGLMVAFSMAFAGYEAGRTAVERFLEGGLAVEPGLPTLVLVFSALLKVGMFYGIKKISQQVNSPALRTTAQDNLNDVFTSLAAFIGALGSSLVHPLLDAIAGILVALWIFRSAFNATREHLNFLTGGGASEELRLKIMQTAEAVPGVLRVHHLMTDYSGPRLVVDLHVNVNGDTPLRDSHEITDQVIAQLQALPDVDRVYVDLEPDDWTD